MEQEILNRLAAQDQLLQKIDIATEKTRRYLAWTFWLTVVFFIVPIVLLAIAIPALLSSMGSLYGL